MANINNPNTNNNSESKLINQGSYGCIYYPSLPFTLQKKHDDHGNNNNNNMEKRKRYVSKLQKHNFHSEFEDYIGKKIQDIPSFDIFFVPVLSTHKIDLATIKQSHVTECDAISKYMTRSSHHEPKSNVRNISSNDYQTLNKQFIIQKMKYINGINLRRHLLQVVTKQPNTTRRHDRGSDSDSGSDYDSDYDSDYVSKTLRKDEQQIKKYRSEFKQDETVSSYNLMSIVFDIYERIMDSIQLLIKFKIVHYDLKENNILVEKIQQLPYIIDFGLSIDISRLLEYKWSDKYEEADGSKSKASKTIDSEVLYSSGSSKILKDNYLWKQHFYIHAPDYFAWPIEVHIMTYLINEHSTLTDESLRKICYDYIANNRAITYMSRDFKKKMFDISVATFSRFIQQPREKVLNELIKYWDKWDIYAINIMFLKIMYELVFHREIIATDENTRRSESPVSSADTDDTDDTDDSSSLNEERQHKLDPHYSSDTKIEFKSKYKVKPKQKYSSHKIMNAIQVMLRNIHPNPDKRMTPQETKTFFVSIFYEC
jgi:hypothetical protein